MQSLQLPLVQRTFRRSLSVWLDAIGQHLREVRRQGVTAARRLAVRRLADSLAAAATTYALEELERLSREVVDASDPASFEASLEALCFALRRGMHPEARPRGVVLIVSADPETIEHLTDVAQPHAHRIEVFSAVSDARAFAVRGTPGMILLDGSVADDPLGWLVELRALPVGADLPVLVLADAGGLRRDAQALGASEVVDRAYEPYLLGIAIAAYLGAEGRTMLELQGDPVTGLPGPALFQEAVADQAIRHHGRKWCVAVLVWRNRAVLDRMDAGLAQEVARALGASLRERFRDPSLVVRLDQDTFGLLLPDAEEERLAPELDEAVHSLMLTIPGSPDLGVGGVLCLEADYSQVLATAHRMQNLAGIAGHRVLLTTVDEVQVQRLLLVDSDPEVASVLRSIVRDSRLDVVYRRSAVEALETAGAVVFDMVVLSASLANHSAFDLLVTLRGWPQYAMRPILMLTTEDRERIRAFELGADDCVGAPFNPDVLRARLRGLLARS